MNDTKWTRFMDMHSGGGQKLDWGYIYIEAPEQEAKVIFYNRFGRNPNRVTCTCCGEDYSLSEADTLAEVTGYERGCDYRDRKYVEAPSTRAWASEYVPLDEFLAKATDRLFIYAADIKPKERQGSVPDEGYVWAGG